MEPVLTIGLPTYNRADLLDRQLAWLAKTTRESGARLEIIVSDNCSTDRTPDIISKWEPAFKHVRLLLNRNAENIGPIRNIALCIQSASARHVWVISDDDLIEEGALSRILKTLTSDRDLALLVLNFSSKHFKTGEVLFEKCFSITGNRILKHGKALFEQCLGQSYGGVTLMTALVYRTDLAKKALGSWPAGLDNLSLQTYITGFCALYGSATVTDETYLTCIAGNHFFSFDPELTAKLFGRDKYAAYLRLCKLGYKRSIGKIFLRLLINKTVQNISSPREFFRLAHKAWGLIISEDERRKQISGTGTDDRQAPPQPARSLGRPKGHPDSDPESAL